VNFYSHYKSANDFPTGRFLIGAGLGGLGGAGLGALSGLAHEAFLADPDKAQYLRRALQGMTTGGIAGSLIGGGIGASPLGQDIADSATDTIGDIAGQANMALLKLIANNTNAISDATKIEGAPFGISPKVIIDPNKLVPPGANTPRPEFASAKPTK